MGPTYFPCITELAKVKDDFDKRLADTELRLAQQHADDLGQVKKELGDALRDHEEREVARLKAEFEVEKAALHEQVRRMLGLRWERL